MTVPAQPGSTGPLAGNGSNNLWSFSFSAASADEVAVYRRPAGGSAARVSSSEYTVALSASGGTVTYPITTARVPDGETVEIRLSPAFDQPTRFTDQGAYDPTAVMGALDHQARMSIALLAAQGRNIEAPAGIAVSMAQPVDGAPLYWRLLASGAYEIANGQPSSGTPSELRVLYADDLGLLGDGTDETATLNAKILAQSQTGKPAIFFLRAPIGYWRFNGQVKNRSGVGLMFGSPIKVGKDGCLAFVGNYAREATGATVSAAISAGATVIPVTPTSGTVSSQLAVADQIELGSERVRVTAVDDNALTVTVTPATTADIAVGATLRKLVSSYISSSWTRQDAPSEIAVADPSKFPTGSLVWVTDDETITHTDGVQTALLNSEMATVLGQGVGTILLDRSIRHWMSTTNRARVVKIDPCAYATIQGASIEFTEAPDSTRVDTLQSSLGFECEFLDCRIPNLDNFGSRGQGFRFYRSYRCRARSCGMGPTKYHGDGEGYGVSIRESTGIVVDGFEGTGCRHVINFSGATDSEARGVKGRAWWNNLVDFHGLREIGCWVYDVQGEATDIATATARHGVSLGNGSWLAGAFESGVIGGEISDLNDTSGIGVRINVPCDDVDVLGIIFRRVNTGIHAENVDNFETTEAGRVRIACDFHRVAKCGTVDMDKWGGTGKPFNKLDLSGCRFFDWVDGLSIDNCDDVVTGDEDRVLHMETVRAGADTYALDVQSCTAALLRATFDGAQKHIRLIDTPARVEHCTVRNPQTTTWLDELSASPVSGGVRDVALTHPDGWVPARVSAQSTLTVYSLPGML